MKVYLYAGILAAAIAGAQASAADSDEGEIASGEDLGKTLLEQAQREQHKSLLERHQLQLELLRQQAAKANAEKPKRPEEKS